MLLLAEFNKWVSLFARGNIRNRRLNPYYRKVLLDLGLLNYKPLKPMPLFDASKSLFDPSKMLYLAEKAIEKSSSQLSLNDPILNRDLVLKIFTIGNANRKQLREHEVKHIQQNYATLLEKTLIKVHHDLVNIKAHCISNPGDKCAKVRYIHFIHTRRGLLRQLSRQNNQSYKHFITTYNMPPLESPSNIKFLLYNRKYRPFRPYTRRLTLDELEIHNNF